MDNVLMIRYLKAPHKKYYKWWCNRTRQGSRMGDFLVKIDGKNFKNIK